MKRYNKIQIILILLFILTGIGCEDFLKEKAITSVTADSYVINESGFEDLVKACYPLLRNIIDQPCRYFVLNGTDIFSTGDWDEAATEAGNPLELYDTRFNPSIVIGDQLDQKILESYWTTLYSEVGRTNTAITRAENVTYSNEDLKAVRVSEAKFLRSLTFFYLVQQFGDIPMPLTETKTSDRLVVRVPAAQVYTQIINDLIEVESILPATASNYGRVTKGAAQFLLARVYLARGWNYNNSLGGNSADFNSALTWADKVIAAYPLVANYKSLFPNSSQNPLTQVTSAGSDKNSEVVFAVQYSNNVLTYGEGNTYHGWFGGNAEDIPGTLGRTSDYNRFLARHVPTPAAYRLYDPDVDKRYKHNFNVVSYALKAVNDFPYDLSDLSKKINIAKGDTVVYYRPWNKPAAAADKGIDIGGNKKYAVINTDEFSVMQTTAYHTENPQPMFWKFWEPLIPYGDAYGTWDFALFRSAEAYLIAAEAIVKGATSGALGGADVYYNKVLDRAVGAGVDPYCAKYPENVASLDSVSYRATPANISIDMILDERARELMGEYQRWFDLKRTGKLIERTTKMNPWTDAKGQLDEHHLVRPIPQSEIDRSLPPISQNDRY